MMDNKGWLIVDPSEGSSGTTETIVVKTKGVNISSQQRNATLVFTAGDKAKREVKVTQGTVYDPFLNPFTITLGTTELVWKDYIIIQANPENTSEVKWTVPESALRYVSTGVTDNVLTVKYDKLMIETDSYESFSITILCETVEHNQQDLPGRRTLTLMLVTQEIKRFDKPYINNTPIKTTATSIEWSFPWTTASNIGDSQYKANTYTFYWGSDPSSMPQKDIIVISDSTLVSETGWTYTCSGLKEGERVYIKMKASDSNSKYVESEFSETRDAVTDKLAEPKVSLANTDAIGFRVNWTEISGADSYRVFINPDYVNGKLNSYTDIESFIKAIETNPDGLAYHDVKNTTSYEAVARVSASTDVPTEDINYFVGVVAKNDNNTSQVGITEFDWLAGRTDPYFKVYFEVGMPALIPSEGIVWKSKILTNVEGEKGEIKNLTRCIGNISGDEATITVAESEVAFEENVGFTIQSKNNEIGTKYSYNGRIMSNTSTCEIITSIGGDVIENGATSYEFTITILENGKRSNKEIEPNMINVQLSNKTLLKGDIIVETVQGNQRYLPTHKVKIPLETHNSVENKQVDVIVKYIDAEDDKVINLVFQGQGLPKVNGILTYDVCKQNNDWIVGSMVIGTNYPTIYRGTPIVQLVAIYAPNSIPPVNYTIKIKGEYYGGFAEGEINTLQHTEFSILGDEPNVRQIINPLNGKVYYGVIITTAYQAAINKIENFSVV